MNNHNETISILMADDDEDDCLMTKEALEEAKVENNIYFVKDGEDLMDYLYHRGSYSDEEKFPRPGLILLDLNMPRKDGREALGEIKADPMMTGQVCMSVERVYVEEPVAEAFTQKLGEIKADPTLRQIPIVVLTTSKAEEDVYRTYDLGVNSFITKPVLFEGLVEVMKTLSHYWFSIVKLP